MTDTVKLIIEMPKTDYEWVKRFANVNTLIPVYDALAKAFLNGIPLDDVKAEIEKHQHSREYCCDHNIDTAIDMSMVRIILDNIGKED